MILIESHPDDDHLAPVRAELEREGHEVVVLDSGRYPLSTSLTIEYDVDETPRLGLTVDGADHDLGDCRAAWWRRPLPYTLDPVISDPAARAFALSECDEGLQGWRSLLKVSWVNDPARDLRATHKAYQLREARRAGLITPQTMITNNPAQARRFVADRGSGRTVYKSFLAQAAAWRETRVLKPDEVDRLDLVRHAPVIFQEYVDGDLDLRVTVIGDQVLAAAVNTGATGYTTDYRLELDTVAMEPYVLPEQVRRNAVRLMRRLGLVYGALDFRVRPDGEHVFFEVNPSGQWLFVEEKTGLPLTRTFVSNLAAADRGRPHPRSAPSGCRDCEVEHAA